MPKYSNLYERTLDTETQAFWTIDVDNGSTVERFTRSIRFLDWSSVVNEMSWLKFRIFEEPDQGISEGDEVTLLADNDPVWMGDVYDITQISKGEYEIEVYGPTKRFERANDNFTLEDADYTRALSKVVSNEMRVNALSNFEQLGAFNGLITLDDDQDNKFDVLTRAVEELGGEFYVSLRNFVEENNDATIKSSPSLSSNFSFEVSLNQESIIREVGFEMHHPAEVQVTIFQDGDSIASRTKRVQVAEDWTHVRFCEWDYIDISTASTDPDDTLDTNNPVVVEVDVTEYKGSSYVGGAIYVGNDSASENLYSYNSSTAPVGNKTTNSVVTVRDVTDNPNSNVSVETLPAMNIVIPDLPSTTDKTYGFQTDPNNTQQITFTERQEEVYDQVVVKGNASGVTQDRSVYPDPTVKDHPNLPEDPKTLVVERKANAGILPQNSLETWDALSEDEIIDNQLMARAIYNERKDEWKEVSVVPVNHQFVHDFEDKLEIVDDSHGYTLNARVIGRRHIFDPMNVEYQDEVNVDYSEILCDSKPAMFSHDVANTDRRFKEAEGYGQGHRNTIVESSQSLTDKDGELRVSFEVPTRFTEDVLGRNRIITTTLDITNDRYTKVIDTDNLSSDNYVNTEKSSVDTSVTDFGDVKDEFTDKDSQAQADLTFIQDGAVLSGGATVVEESQSSASVSGGFSGTIDSYSAQSFDDTAGLKVFVTASVLPSAPLSDDATLIEHNFSVTDGDGNLVGHTVKSYSRHRVVRNSDDNNTWSYDTTCAEIHVYENTIGKTYNLNWAPQNSTPSAQFYVNWHEKGEHTHDLDGEVDGVDNTQARIISGGDLIDAGENADQSSEQLINDKTNLISYVNKEDNLTFALADTTIDTVDVVVENSNGSTTVGTFDVQPGSDKVGSAKDIDISSKVVTSGRNVVKIIPNQGKGKLTGRVILDHTLDTRKVIE